MLLLANGTNRAEAKKVFWNLRKCVPAPGLRRIFELYVQQLSVRACNARFSSSVLIQRSQSFGENRTNREWERLRTNIPSPEVRWQNAAVPTDSAPCHNRRSMFEPRALAEGEELGSNILRVSQRSPANSSVGRSERTYIRTFSGWLQGFCRPLNLRIRQARWGLIPEFESSRRYNKHLGCRSRLTNLTHKVVFNGHGLVA